MKKIITLIVVMLLMAASQMLNAQISFFRTYGGSNGESGKSVQQTTDGGFIAAGWTESFVNSSDMYLVKTDAVGDTQWTRAYGVPDNNWCNEVRQTADGGYIVCGFTTFQSTTSALYLIKTDSTGNPQWTKFYSGIEPAFSIRQTSDGGYVAISKISIQSNLSGLRLLRFNSVGDTLWTRTFSYSINLSSEALEITADHGFIISGQSTTEDSVTHHQIGDIILLKTDGNGVEQWRRFYHHFERSLGHDVATTTDGGYIIGGVTESDSVGAFGYVIKTDANGDTLWTKLLYDLTHTYDFHIESIVQNTDGGYAYCGYSELAGPPWDIVFFARTDTAGDTLWMRKAWFESDGYSMQQCADGGFIVCGSSPDSTNDQLMLIKSDSSGNVVSVSEINKPQPFFVLYPNPANSIFTIRIDAEIKNAQVEIFSLLGKKVCNKQFAVGKKEMQIDASGLSKGIYFVKVGDVEDSTGRGEKMSVQKLVIQ